MNSNLITPIDFQSIKKLYHYTSFETALKIIASGQLRYGRLSNMNDVNEAYKFICFDPNIDINTQDVLDELLLYRQLSFSQDGDNLGYNITPMWGHYAQKGRGVCLVFDRCKLESKLSGQSDVFSNAISYISNYSGEIDIKSTNITQCVSGQRDKIFFYKSTEWDYEQEYRVVKRIDDINRDEYLDVKDCLIAVIMYYADDVNPNNSVFGSLNSHILKKVCGDKLLILELSNVLGYNGALCDCEGKLYSASSEKSTIDV